MLSAAAFAQPHDGPWWQSTLEDQRNEYLNGYMDCAVYDGGRRDLPSVGTVEIAQAIQAFYDSNPKMANASVVTVLEQVSKQKACIANLCQVGKSGQTSTPIMTANIGLSRIWNEQVLCRVFASAMRRFPQNLASQKATLFMSVKSQLGTATQSIATDCIQALPMSLRSMPTENKNPSHQRNKERQ